MAGTTTKKKAEAEAAAHQGDRAAQRKANTKSKTNEPTTTTETTVIPPERVQVVSPTTAEAAETTPTVTAKRVVVFMPPKAETAEAIADILAERAANITPNETEPIPPPAPTADDTESVAAAKALAEAMARETGSDEAALAAKRAVGAILNMVHKRLSHGQWGRWCANYWPRTIKTAWRYRNLDTHWERIQEAITKGWIYPDLRSAELFVSEDRHDRDDEECEARGESSMSGFRHFSEVEDAEEDMEDDEEVAVGVIGDAEDADDSLGEIVTAPEETGDDEETVTTSPPMKPPVPATRTPTPVTHPKKQRLTMARVVAVAESHNISRTKFVAALRDLGIVIAD